MNDDSCKTNRNERNWDEIRFAGITSAIRTLLNEMGHKSLDSISTGSATLVYSSSSENLICVAEISDDKYKKVASFFIRQLEREFLNEYASKVDLAHLNYVDVDFFEPFETKATMLYEKIVQLYEQEPLVFEVFEPDMPIEMYYALFTYEKDLLESYPEHTIKYVRDLYSQHPVEKGAAVLDAIGHVFGYKLRTTELSSKIVASIEDLMRLLNEISIAEYNHTTHEVVLKICPICRGFKADKPICYFFTGFIRGFLNNPKLVVQETKCKAQEDQNCVFEIKEEV